MCGGTRISCFSALYSQLMYIMLLLRKTEDVTFSFCLALNLILNFPSILFMPVCALDIAIFHQVFGNFFSLIYIFAKLLAGCEVFHGDWVSHFVT